MSLNFDFSKTEFLREHGTIWSEHTDQWGSKALLPDVAALVWGGMAIGMGTVTKTNIEVWVGRISLYESVYGPIVHEWRLGHPKEGKSAFDIDTLVKCVGMSLNVANESRATFLKNLTRGMTL